MSDAEMLKRAAGYLYANGFGVIGNEVLALAARLPELERDAARYEFIRDAGATFYTGIDTPNEKRHHCCEQAMDAAIDAAMQEPKP